MELGSVDAVATSLLSPRRQREHAVQDVFSAVLAEVGREGYASANPVADDRPMEEQIVACWFDWFDGERQGGRYATTTEAEALKQSYGELLVRAYDEGGHAAPKDFLARLSKDELAVVQHVHALADPILVDRLAEEGAMNLLLPPAAQVDLNGDGLTQSGAAYGFRFPDSTTPPEVVQAWEEATAGMSWGEQAIRQMQMKIPALMANIVCDRDGRFLYRREPGDPDFVNPMASAGYSFQKATQEHLDYLETFRNQMPVDQYERDKAFWTMFRERLVENGAT